MSRFYILVLTLYLQKASAVFNFTEYYQMPPMARFDEYERCILGYEELSVYCVVKTSIKPNEDHSLWNYIKNFSSDTMHHFRHDILTTGLCVNWCKKKLSKLDVNLYEALYEPYFDASIKYPVNPDDFNGTREFRREYGDLVNRCVNLYLKEEYNLTGYSEISFCSTNKEVEENDGLDWIFLIITLITFTLVIIASFYDYRLRQDTFTVNNEKSSKKEQLLLAFSVISNWERLTSVPKAGMAHEFRHIQAVRYLTMFIIIYGHINIGYNGPILNPEYHEERFHIRFYHIFLNGTMVVQTFFFISGFLLAVHFIEELMHKRHYNFKYFYIAVIYRYLRLTPVYMYVLLFDATFLVKTQVGPLWKRQAGLEKVYCRRNWWTNLLYVNNHMHVEDGCMPHSWYMAADTQLFCIGMFILMIVWKCPRITRHLILGATIFFCIVPGIITYINGYDGVFTVPPEDRIHMNQMPSFKDAYVPFYASAGNYFIGILSGYLYHVIRRSTYQPSARTKKIIKYTFCHMFIIGVYNFYFSYIFYDYKFEKPAIWIAIYAIISKNMWGYSGTFFMFCFYCKAVPAVSRFLNARIFQALGRVTYCVYLVHFTLLRIASAEGRGAAVVRTLSMFGYTTIGLIYSTFLGLVLCLCLEFPITALLKIMMPDRKASTNEITNEMNMMGSPLKNKFDYYNNVNKFIKENCVENGTLRNVDDNNNNE